MQQNSKIKLTKEEFDEMYEIEEITGETGDKGVDQSMESPISDKQNTTPEFLTEEEEEFDKQLEETLNQNEEKQE